MRERERERFAEAGEEVDAKTGAERQIRERDTETGIERCAERQRRRGRDRKGKARGRSRDDVARASQAGTEMGTHKDR